MQSPFVSALGTFRFTPFIASGILLAGLPLAAQDVVWVAQVSSPPGEEFKTLLTEKGYVVTEIITTSATLTGEMIDRMNAADVVIFSRKAASGEFNTPDWNAISAPMIVFSPYVTRSSHWGWFTGTGLADATPAQIYVEAAQHPLFAGIEVVDGVTGPWHIAIDQGTSFPTDPVDNGGILLASTPEGYTAAAEWPEGAVADGPRLLLCMGSREASGSDITQAGKFNVTELGAQILVNAVKYYSPLVDSDGDGVPDSRDAFPNDPTEWEDTDGDGIGNNADPDDDNDGIPDTEDALPLDPTESKDTDGDGIGDNSDPDIDGDWVPNEEDAFPLDPNEWDDTDGDGIGDNSDPDADGDGVPDPPVTKVVWASIRDNDTGHEFIDLLTEAGYTVERFVGDSATLEADPVQIARVFHTASVVIFSRQFTSSSVNTPIWNQIKTPMIVMTPYVTRRTFWGWLMDEGLVDEFPFVMNVLEPSHLLFENVTVDTSGFTEAWHFDVNRGTSFAVAQEVTNGTVLATTETGSLAAVQWPAGTVALGPRMLLCMGAREAGDQTIDSAGMYNLTELGAKIFLNAVALYASPVAPPPPGESFEITSITYQANPRQVTLTWPSEPGQAFSVERSTSLAGNSWTVVQDNLPSAGTTTQFTDSSVPEGAPAVYYRVVRK